MLGGILRDANRPQQLPTTGKLPPELIFPNPHFLRPCLGIPVPGDVRLHFHAVDLARSPEGHW